MKDQKTCPYYTNFGYRGCHLGCSCHSYTDECYPKHAILNFDKIAGTKKQTAPGATQVDVGVCWPSKVVLIALTIAVFFVTLGCVIGIRKCALDYTYSELEKIHVQLESEAATSYKGFASGTVRVM